VSHSDARPLSRATLAALAGGLALAGAILLAGGAGSALAAPSCAPSGANTVCTFSTPGPDTFIVPAGVTEASFDSFGAQGGSVEGFTDRRSGRPGPRRPDAHPRCQRNGGSRWNGRLSNL
jgi:hypothetical protein